LDSDGGDGFEADEFVKDLIITPPMTRGNAKAEVDVPSTIKRNLTNVFDEVGKVQSIIPLKKVKNEKE
jgi:hypothetical protein